MRKLLPQINWKLKNVKYFLVGLLFCLVAITPLSHTFLSKTVDRCYDKMEIELQEGLNSFDGVEILISNGKIVKVQEVKSEVINKVFGWSNTRKFLLLGSPYFCLVALSAFSIWIFIREERDEYFKKTVRVVLSFFCLISVWFSIYALWPRGDLPYVSYYFLLLFGASVINVGAYYFYQWVKTKTYHVDQLMFKIRSLTRFISDDIYIKYVKKADQKDYLIDMAKNYKKLNN